MHVVFLEIDTEAEWIVASLGPAFLAALARNMGHTAELHRVTVDRPLAQVVEDVRALAPDLIGISMTTRQWLRGRDVANAVRPALGVPVIAGGLHPTFSPELTLAEPGFDLVCLGEGERPFAALLTEMAAGTEPRDLRIPGLWVRGGTHPGLSPPVERIDEIPFMARDMLDEKWGQRHLSTQRGCPFPCTYCAARMFDQLYEGSGAKYGRRRSIGNVIAECEAIAAEMVLNYVFFLDDTFTINQPWVLEFAKVFPKRVGVGFSVHARADGMNDRVIGALAEAGCRHIVYGVESGSERVRREIMKRPMTNARLVDVFRRTREAGIMPTANYMLGLPGETPAEMRETIALHRELQPVGFGAAVFYPFPGTQLFETCRQSGYLPADWASRPATHDRSILTVPEHGADDIAEVLAEWEAVRAEDLARQRAAAEATVAAPAPAC